MAKTKINAEQRAEILALKGTANSTSIGRQFGLAPATVRWLWSDHDKPPKPKAERKIDGEKPEPKPILEDQIIESGVTLMNLSDDQCRWIIGKDTEGHTRYCGCDRTMIGTKIAVFTSSYCPKHEAEAKGETRKFTPEQRAKMKVRGFERVRDGGHRGSAYVKVQDWLQGECASNPASDATADDLEKVA